MDATPIVSREDTRVDPNKLGAERELLEQWLDLYRETVFLKISDLNAGQLASRPFAYSNQSLLGVVRHLTEVEAYWLREVLEDEQDLPDYYATRDHPDGEFDFAAAESAADDVAAYERELHASRANVAKWDNLDIPVKGLRKGEPVNLRWILMHLIEEYARHLGHMDFLREAVDGRTGY